ncbi:hypothetical protein RJ639_007456 [Escallonia herrerae]|uniref:Uncharacterized protein n=1 Tax=Escallonia herrerae TaxID=1293975 RepID=A0AA89AUM9_9ASTE|nr:hypothetical protein RJ639_007456 [Escallonia herrerae]
MKGQSSYVPPSYLLLDQSDPETDTAPSNEDIPVQRSASDDPAQWALRTKYNLQEVDALLIHADLDRVGEVVSEDLPFLHDLIVDPGEGVGEAIVAVLPGSCGVGAVPMVGVVISASNRQKGRRLVVSQRPFVLAIGDFQSHFFCHLCATCQEYREIRERSGDCDPPDLSLVEVTAPPVRTMESASKE